MWITNVFAITLLVLCAVKSTRAQNVERAALEEAARWLRLPEEKSLFKDTWAFLKSLSDEQLTGLGQSTYGLGRSKRARILNLRVQAHKLRDQDLRRMPADLQRQHDLVRRLLQHPEDSK